MVIAHTGREKEEKKRKGERHQIWQKWDIAVKSRGTEALDNGVATLTVSDLNVEDHYITATYNGDTTYVTSASDEFDQEVDAATVSVTIPTTATYADGLVELDATVSVATGSGTPTGTVEFYDGSTDLGAGTAGDAGQWSLTTSAVVPGSHSITAVYSGDDYFAGNQSTGTAVTVNGETLSFASLNGGGLMNEGNTASVSGNVSNLNGAAFSVNVDWGDGQSGDTDNGGRPFYFAAGTTSFSISHYYNTVGGYTLDVTAAASDGRQVEDNTSVSLTVVGVAPKVILIEPPEPPDGWDPNTQYTVSAVAYSPDSGSLSYQWTLEGTTVLWTGASVTITGAEFDDVWLTVSSGAGPATTVALCDPNNSMGVFTSVAVAVDGHDHRDRQRRDGFRGGRGDVPRSRGVDVGCGASDGVL